MELDGTDQNQKESLAEARFEPFPTPSPTPPAAMLAASIRGIQDTEIPKAGMSQIPRTEGWEAAKAASTRGIQDKEIQKTGISHIPRTGGWHCLKHQSMVYKTKIQNAEMSQLP